MTEAVTNVVWNLSVPYRAANIQGTLQHIITEVAVSKTLRWLLKWENRSFMDLAIIHSVSQPFLGALFFGDPIRTLAQQPTQMEAATDGAKETPAVLIAAYILASAKKGLHIPRFTIKDIGLTLVSKVASRLVEANIYNSLSVPMQQATVAPDTMVAIQTRNSRFVGV